MNDDFLHRIRVQPSATFLAGLKTRLDRQVPPPPPKPRRTVFRALAWGLLFGGSAFAITLLTTTGGRETVRDLLWTQPQPSLASTARTAAEPGSDQPARTQNTRPTHEPETPAPSDATSPTAPATQKASTPPIRNIFDFVTPKALHGYMATLASDQYPKSITPSMKDVASTSEALAQVCTNFSAAAVIATRRITRSEFEPCTRSGARISEVVLGHQAIVVARSKAYGAFNLTPRALFLALAAEVPDPTRPEEFIANPYRSWSRVDSTLENEPIEVIGPPLSSTTGMAFRELLLEAGCNTFPSITALKQSDSARYERVCRTVRKDGIYIELPESRAQIIQRLQLNPNTLGILGYSQFSAAVDSSSLALSPISGVEPTLETIVSGAYPASQPLYIYFNLLRSSGFTSYSLRRFVDGNGFLPETYSMVPADPTRAGASPNNPLKLSDLNL